ncbi:MAG: zf-HC2 domain-containing protein [Bryobacteraceae bacterium]|jgi:hypothetical protein
MSCEKSLELVSSVLDGGMTAEEREKAMAHVESCEVCNSGYWSLYNLRQSLRAIRQPVLPAWMAPRLRMIASDQAARQRRRAERAARFTGWVDRVRLSFDNLMRPMALPVAGGLLSALLLFGAVVQQVFPDHFRNDVPTMISTDPDGQVVDWTPRTGWMIPRLEPVNTEVTGNATVVEVTIDPNGYVADYTVVRGELPQEAKNLFLWSKFTPATLFGQPTWGKKLILFRRSASTRS